MKTWNDVIAVYAKEFGPIFRMAHDGWLVVEDENGIAYLAPDDETVAKFVDRMKRSVIANTNLFFKEYKVMEQGPNFIY